ncbi:MAG: ATP-binding cassette domain-containing protein [Bacteroidales bacterium]|nr:MAG: ATP-binding cassette domain-containing protein [Bacteroidales bacterium]
MIKVNDLVKSYNGRVVLDIPELSISKGECFGLVGNNGAGKTTFFRLVLDLILPDRGLVQSKDLIVRMSEEWKSYTGSFLDEGFLIGFLTPGEYFEFLGKLNRMTKPEVYMELERYDGLLNGEAVDEKKYIRKLSRGNQKKVGIVAALFSRPEVLVLDEPFANLDPTSVSRLIKILNGIKKEWNPTMLISSHNLNHITEVCERIDILEEGKIIRDIKDNPNALRDLEDYFAV